MANLYVVNMENDKVMNMANTFLSVEYGKFLCGEYGKYFSGDYGRYFFKYWLWQGEGEYGSSAGGRWRGVQGSVSTAGALFHFSQICIEI